MFIPGKGLSNSISPRRLFGRCGNIVNLQNKLGCVSVIIILKSEVTDEQVGHVVERVEALGLKAHLSRGTYRTIIGVIGDEQKIGAEPLRAIPGVQEVIPVLPPYKLASREAHPQPSIVDVAGVKIGGGNLAMIAGPCAVEEPERMDAIGAAVKAAGANIFRGGAFKPRTSPYAFQGMGEDGAEAAARDGRQVRPAGRDRGDGPAVRRGGRALRRHDPDRCAEHAELRAADRGGPHAKSRCCSSGA